MCIGFLCRDGVVIGADRQVTGQHYTFPECKIIYLHWKNGTGILGYSGNRDTYLNFCGEIGARLATDAVLDEAALKKLLRDCMDASLQKKEEFYTLFGFCLDGESPAMVMTTAAKRVVDVADCEVIGYGDSPLSRSLLGRLLWKYFGKK